MLSMRRSARLGRDDKEVSRKCRVRRSWEQEEQWTTRRRARHERNTWSSGPAEGEPEERAGQTDRQTDVLLQSAAGPRPAAEAGAALNVPPACVRDPWKRSM